MRGMKFRLPRFWVFVPLLIGCGLAVMLTTARRSGVGASCTPNSQTGEYEKGADLAVYEGEEIGVPKEAVADAGSGNKVLGTTDPNSKWIEVSLGEQKLRAWDGNTLFLETPVSSGLARSPTPKGEFRIWSKFRYTRMEGGEGKYYYNLPNVPYVMFFQNDQVAAYRGYSLHGTYWHNDFGRVHSHGCVNLPTPIAEKLY